MSDDEKTPQKRKPAFKSNQTPEFQAWAKGEPGRAVRDIMLRHIRKDIVLLIAACTDPWVFMILQQDHFRRSVMGYWRGWKVN